MDGFSAAYRGSVTARVDFMATVASTPRYFVGTRTHRTHESFAASTVAGPVQIVDNVDIAPRCPVRVGDSIEVRGEMVHDPGRPPIVHWTHHDPAHRHPDGFIRLHGHLYA
ncbi:MAG: DUF3465 domain-containing protein [Candidatus Eremiobacteraeota bacterium]|nr:DUF3465 domain-containing protein [Candidatus Eremiobacteraeota bacterium]MBV8654907.1 DUF3465 domain-containing protein [Candidatus Eremiobacteraeota bacterium]